jgi:hypothetical protein
MKMLAVEEAKLESDSMEQTSFRESDIRSKGQKLTASYETRGVFIIIFTKIRHVFLS